jgi:1,4-dihydroxy-2-naphthoyl-CoA synthase
LGEALGAAGPTAADLVIGSDDADDLLEAVGRAPIAARSLAMLLRTLTDTSVAHGLMIESAVYSTLQAGPEFAAWRSKAAHPPDDHDAPTVLVERHDGELHIKLNRPHRHNAISARLRDELCAALKIAEADDTVGTVVMSGNGPSFCSGGDLGEFGQRSDPATAHTIRLTHSPARQIDRLRSRLTARIHGATLGGGIEMASFAGRVIADPDTLIGLPEIGLGLVPGAGGTIGLTRRIGRQRTAALALTGRTIDASKAMHWGIVDEIA